jgi:phthiocerol/phthiodiolone dimycocerosyl transferase-like enzyme
VLERYLDDIETQLKDTAPSYCLAYRGSLRTDDVARAIEHLAIEQPVLRARIIPDADGHLLRAEHSGLPPLIVLDGGEQALLRAISADWAVADGVARFFQVRHATGGFVALRMDHAVHDGGMKMFLFRRFWQVLADIVAGRDLPPMPGTTLPVPPGEVLATHFPHRPRPAPPRRTGRPYRRQSLDAHQRVLRLHEHDTGQLVTAARHHRTSVHAFICGAILVAQSTRGGTDRPAAMLCLSPVHLRDRVQPPVPAGATTRFVGIHRATVLVGPAKDPIVVGTEIKRQLENDIASGNLITDTIQEPLPWVDSGWDVPIAHASISNYGVVEPFTCPPRLSTMDFRTLSDMRTGVFPTYAAYTYEERLSIRAVFPANFYTAHDVDRLIDRVNTLLVDIGQRATHPSH